MKKADFLKDINPWGSHRVLLFEALEATKEFKLPVLELGSGPSSTPYLRQWCKDEGLFFETYETDKKWAVEMNSKWVMSWDAETFWPNSYSVCLLDMAPGNYRKVALEKLKNVQIICIHDSEIKGWNASDYQVRPIFSKFKYMIDDVPEINGAPWTTCLSNTIDVSLWKK